MIPGDVRVCEIDKYKPLKDDRRLRDWTKGLTSLSEKVRGSNHLQMLECRQHLLVNYFKILSVGLARN